MTETYTLDEFRNSRAHGSDFLDNIQTELHVIYGPDRVLIRPEAVIEQ